MRTSLIALSVALLLPLGAMAQSTDTTTEGTATEDAAPENTDEAPTVGNAIEDQLSLGEDASSPQVGQTYTKETNGDWELRCIKAEEGEEPCQMYQLLSDDEGTPVAEVSIFRLPEGGRAVAGATIIVPLETSLPQQLTMEVDGGQARRYPYAFCNPIGCYSRVGLVAEEVAQFRRGANAKLTIVPALAPDQKVELTMSLKGFTASFDKTSIAQF
ncbi:invasion associated locus B family protein [uncultured Tateyamaria sp.]|uniref:invasion associated locus B family protein n=1 Tax=uncultured Tateyamaria sp. TaxID=455651 RepID=UPI001DAC5DF7|nr:invasion associated locus B family protein [uncultured Tateyamaria sp.]MCB4379581.1 invasion associated locus B family protein [Synechococcus sp. MU1644]